MTFWFYKTQSLKFYGCKDFGMKPSWFNWFHIKGPGLRKISRAGHIQN
jgi:hypothetical protein